MPVVEKTITDGQLGLAAPDILLPAKTVAYHTWAVIACDQYTSDMRYWDTVESMVGDNPSTLGLVIPEAYLQVIDQEARAREIVARMHQYIEDGILVSMPRCPVLIRRFFHNPQKQVSCRIGLLAALDLEQYDFHPGSHSLIRATEKTILHRLPARVGVRRRAPIEIPHILVFIDDPEGSVIESLASRIVPSPHEAGSIAQPAGDSQVLYDFDLLAGGGHVEGRRVSLTEWEQVQHSLHRLAMDRLEQQIPGQEKPDHVPPPLFAVGDGNHSLAAAKVVWEELKENGAPPDHPARWALAEICNVYNPAIQLHPIHRILFGIEAQTCIEAMNQSGNIIFRPAPNTQAAVRSAGCTSSAHCIGIISGNLCGTIVFENPTEDTATGTFQPILDRLLETGPGIEIDYIHESETVLTLSKRTGTVGLIFPAIETHQIFSVIQQGRVFPRKTFSIGTANEKRYYLECRRIQ